MTDLGQGVHLIGSGSRSWEPDDEVGGFLQVLFEEGDAAVGLWKPRGEDPVAGNLLSARETVVVLQGTVRIEIVNGPTLELAPGDVASLPQGVEVNWFPSSDFVKVWAV